MYNYKQDLSQDQLGGSQGSPVFKAISETYELDEMLAVF